MSALFILTNTEEFARVKERQLEHKLKPGVKDDNKTWTGGFYSPSFVYIYRALAKEGYKIHGCSPKGGAVKPDPTSLELWDHPICNNTLAKPEVIELLGNTKAPCELNGCDFNIIHFPGGHGCFFDVAVDEGVKKLVRECYENGGYISANSDGVSGLLNVVMSNGRKLLDKMKITGLPKIEQNRLDCKDDFPFILEDALLADGANYIPGIPVKDSVQVGNRVITGQNPNSSEPLARCIANNMRKVMRVKRSVLYIMTNVDELPDHQKTGTYVPSIAYPYLELRKAGMFQTFATPDGGPAPIDPFSCDLWDHPEIQDLLKEDSVKAALENTKDLKDIKASDYSVVFFPGGYGGLWDLAENKAVERVVREVYEAGGIIASNSHGAVGLLNVMLSNGEYLVKCVNMTALPKAEEDRISINGRPVIHNFPISLEAALKAQGADFKEGDCVKSHVQTHKGRIITGQNPNSAETIAHDIVRAVKARLGH